MKPIEHNVEHQYQPTITTCGQTALSILLSHFGEVINPLKIEQNVPQVQDKNGQNMGTITQHMATWCIDKGYNVSLYTFDCQVIDQSWFGLGKDELVEKLRQREEGWTVPSLGELWTKEYARSYKEFIQHGGNLHITRAVTSELLYKLLENGPILPCLNFNTLYGVPKSRRLNNQEAVDDDINGVAINHFVVIYGNNEDGNLLIADPWHRPGMQTIEPEILLAAISTAQIECDNLLVQITKK